MCEALERDVEELFPDECAGRDYKFDDMKARAREAGFGVDDARAMTLRAEAASVNAVGRADIERIEADGQAATALGPLTESERRNIEARLVGEKATADNLAEKSGTLNRIETTGLGSKDQERAKAQDRQRVKDDARMQQLLALQAALDAMDADIARLDGEIDALGQLLGIIDSGEKLDPNNPAHRDILKKSGIPEERWDNLTREDIQEAKRERQTERYEKQKEYDRVDGIMKNGTDTEIRDAAESLNIDTVRKTRHSAPDQNQDKVENTLNRRYGEGNAAQQNDSGDFAFVQKTATSLGGKSLLSSGTSLASVVAPTLTAQPSHITPQYNTASRGDEDAPHMQKLAQVTQDQERENTPLGNPLPGTGVS